MKFEFDHKTGMMTPKKDDNIYFGGAISGGLRIDDRKNNVTYIIERDGSLKRIFGVLPKDNINIYDERNARIIADRVLKKFGREHKFADFRMFSRAYHQKIEEQNKIDEGRLVRNLETSFGDENSGRIEDTYRLRTFEVKELLNYLTSFINSKKFTEYRTNKNDYKKNIKFVCDEPITKESIIYIIDTDKKDPFCTVDEMISFIQDDMIVAMTLDFGDDNNKKGRVEAFYEESDITLNDWCKYIINNEGDNCRIFGLCLFDDSVEFKAPYREACVDYFAKFKMGEYRNEYDEFI